MCDPRPDARQLLDERREAEARQQEDVKRRDDEIEAQRVAGLRRGVPWYQIPEGVLPVQAMTQAAHDETPRRRSLVEDFLDRPDDQVVYHPIRGDEDES